MDKLVRILASLSDFLWDEIMRNIACIFLLSLSLTSCVETIVFDPGEKNLPVMVTCLLDPDHDVQKLYLQYVKGKSAAEYVPIEDAEVYVTSKYFVSYLPVDTLHFHNVHGNLWESQKDPAKKIKEGGEYHLSVIIPGRETIHAETTCPTAYAPALYTDLYEVGSWTEHSVYCQIKPSYPNENKQIRTSTVWIFAKGKLKKKDECDEIYPYMVTDHPCVDDFNVNGRKFSELELIGDNDGQVMQVFWPAYENMRRMMPDLPMHDEFIRLEHMDTSRFHLLAGPLEYPQMGKPHQDYLNFTFVSKEYDEYLRNVYTRNQKLDHDLTSIFSTANAYSNIDGGVGIFGSEVSYKVGFLLN